MGLFDIMSKLHPSDVPILTIPEQEMLQDYLQKQDTDVSIEKICEETDIIKERFLEINQEISIHFRDNIAPKVFLKAMMNSEKDNIEEFKQFFLRPDVDLGCLFMSKIVDIKQGMKNFGTPAYQFYLDSWKKYRGY